MGKTIGAPGVTIVDDALIPGGLGSKPFDGEGLPTSRKDVVDKGVLATYLLDCYSARKLGLTPTGNAARSVGEAPSVSTTNLYLEPGSYTPEQIIGSVKQGLYLTETIGFGVNMVTGDYSRGAGGIWIEDGELAYPVQEITIAGNLKDMIAERRNDRQRSELEIIHRRAHAQDCRDDNRWRLNPSLSIILYRHFASA